MSVRTDAGARLSPPWVPAATAMCYTLSEVHTVELESDKMSCSTGTPRSALRLAGVAAALGH